MLLALDPIGTKHGGGNGTTYVDKFSTRWRSAGEYDPGPFSGPWRVTTRLEKDVDNSAISVAFRPAFCSVKTHDYSDYAILRRNESHLNHFYSLEKPPRGGLKRRKCCRCLSHGLHSCDQI